MTVMTMAFGFYDINRTLGCMWYIKSKFVFDRGAHSGLAQGEKYQKGVALEEKKQPWGRGLCMCVCVFVCFGGVGRQKTKKVACSIPRR